MHSSSDYCLCDKCVCDNSLNSNTEEATADEALVKTGHDNKDNADAHQRSCNRGDCMNCGGWDVSLTQAERERDSCAQCCECSPQMHDSGKREEFGTGAVRDDASAKIRPDLFSPFAMERIGEWLCLGAKKYSERNWESGIPISRCIASLERHLLAYKQGKRDEDHLAAVAVNASFVMHYEEMIDRSLLPATLDDMPNYGGGLNARST